MANVNKIKQIIAYKTEGGDIFENLEDAERQQRGVDFRQGLEDYLSISTDLCDTERDTIVGLLTEIDGKQHREAFYNLLKEDLEK